MSKFLSLGVILLSTVISACTTVPRQKTALENARPRSILVVPVVNNSVEVRAATSVLTTLPELLGEKGYYVFPVNTVKTVLEHEGFYEPAEVHAAPPEQLAALFGADAILYVTVHQWAAQYILLQTTTLVDLEYRIVNHDGAELWSARKQLSHTPQAGNTGSPLGNLLVAAVSAALERADPVYLPLTRQANKEAFDTGATALPPGPYAPNYDEYYLAFEPKEPKDSKGK